MPGFLVSSINTAVKLKNRCPQNCIAEEMQLPEQNIVIKRNTLNKFMQDKVFEKNSAYAAVTEGYLLNREFLFEKYTVDNLFDLMIKMYRVHGETFFNEFRGAFAGAFYDIEKSKWLVFTNHIGDNPIFYFCNGSDFIAGSQVNYIIDSCKLLGWNLNFDESAVYQMLTFAFMQNNATYAKEIKRLRGGQYLCIENNRAEIREYHVLKKNPEHFAGKTETEIIEEMDAVFREAVRLEYLKDEEYGYEHLADLSGGLDSRMNIWVAHEMKPIHIQLLTYCKANYMDELIAKNIASFWKDEIVVKPLDDCRFMYDIDETIGMCDGLSLYSGITGGKRLLSSLNMSRYGLEHTGMIGDVVIGSFYKTMSDSEKQRPTGRYSEKLSGRLNSEITEYPGEFDDYEIYLLYTRAFQGAANSHLIRKNYTEVVSPFLYVDFLELCLDIPLELRIGHKIYKKWILTKYPKAAEFKWEKLSAKITDGPLKVLIQKIIYRGADKFKRVVLKNEKSVNGMNPLDYWLANDKELRKYLDTYFQDNWKYIPDAASEQLKTDMKKLYLEGNVYEKSMVLTALGAMKLYFYGGASNEKVCRD